MGMWQLSMVHFWVAGMYVPIIYEIQLLCNLWFFHKYSIWCPQLGSYTALGNESDWLLLYPRVFVASLTVPPVIMCLWEEVGQDKYVVCCCRLWSTVTDVKTADDAVSVFQWSHSGIQDTFYSATHVDPAVGAADIVLMHVCTRYNYQVSIVHHCLTTQSCIVWFPPSIGFMFPD